MRQISIPKRSLALILSVGIPTGGPVLSSTTASAAGLAAVIAFAPQAHSTDDAATIGWFDRFKQGRREAACEYDEADQRTARYFW